MQHEMPTTTADIARCNHINEEIDQAQALADTLEKFVNYGGNTQYLAQIVTQNVHRTLQQGIFKMFLDVCEAWADDKGGHDARNEYTHLCAKEINDMFKPGLVPYI